MVDARIEHSLAVAVALDAPEPTLLTILAVGPHSRACRRRFSRTGGRSTAPHVLGGGGPPGSSQVACAANGGMPASNLKHLRHAGQALQKMECLSA